MIRQSRRRRPAQQPPPVTVKLRFCVDVLFLFFLCGTTYTHTRVRARTWARIYFGIVPCTAMATWCEMNVSIQEVVAKEEHALLRKLSFESIELEKKKRKKNDIEESNVPQKFYFFFSFFCILAYFVIFFTNNKAYITFAFVTW